MKRFRNQQNRLLSIIGFALIVNYFLAIPFNGDLLSGLIAVNNADKVSTIIISYLALFVGLFGTGSFVRKPIIAKHTLQITAMGAVLLSFSFFFGYHTIMWYSVIIGIGLLTGAAMASFGYYFYYLTPKDRRLFSAAEFLFLGHLFYLVLKIVADVLSLQFAVQLALFSLIVGQSIILLLPIESDASFVNERGNRLSIEIKKPLIAFFVFIAMVMSLNGFLSTVVRISFSHLDRFYAWFSLIPFLVMLIVLRKLTFRAAHETFIQLAMFLIVVASVIFTFIVRNGLSYLLISLLWRSAFGILELFWVKTLSEMFDFTANPVKVFGIGVSSMVVGTMAGYSVGVSISALNLDNTQVAFSALLIVILVLILLPSLKSQFFFLLSDYIEKEDVVNDDQALVESPAQFKEVEPVSPLTNREAEICNLIVAGKSNKAIAEQLYISESTVKTHIRSVFNKYEVNSRAELISLILNNPSHT